MAANHRMNNELKRIWKDVVMTWSKVLSQNISGATEVNHGNNKDSWSYGWDSNPGPAEYETLKLTNTWQCQTEWVAFLHHILEVWSSNLGQEASYPDWSVSWFFTVPSGKFWDSNANGATNISFYILPNSLFTDCPTIWHYATSAADSVRFEVC